MPPKVLSLSLMLALLSVGAHAQTVYRIVGPDGKVTFSDRAPDTAAKPAQTTAGTPSGSSAAGAGLPFELGKVAARFPVTLYTGQNCAPCDTARRMLEARGVPFSERTINTSEDLQALTKLGSLTHADVGQMHMYCNYAKEHWAYPDENPPVGLILCADKGHALARYALEGLPTKVMAANYRTVLPDAELLQKELETTRRLLESRAAKQLKKLPQ